MASMYDDEFPDNDNNLTLCESSSLELAKDDISMELEKDLTLPEKQELISEKTDNHTDLTLCGICLATMDNPKALPCLHSFCFGCIDEWVKEHIDIDVTDINIDDDVTHFRCPVCKEDFQLPSDGVTGLRSNFFVTKLKEKHDLQVELEKDKHSCTCCGNLDNIAKARCCDCNEYLCDKCVQIHKTLKALRDHKVYSLEDIQSGLVNINKIHSEEYCRRHKNQILWFYCETCGLSICRDCTVIEHPASSHQLVNLEDIAKKQATNIQELSSNCKKVVPEIVSAINTTDDIGIKLTEALETAKSDITCAVSKVRDHFLATLKVKEDDLLNKLSQIGDDHKAEIMKRKEILESQQSRLKRAIHIADKLTESESPYDMATMHKTLADSMKKLIDMKAVAMQVEFADVRFTESPDCLQDSVPAELGTITHGTDEPADSDQLSGSNHDIETFQENYEIAELPRALFAEPVESTTWDLTQEDRQLTSRNVSKTQHDKDSLRDRIEPRPPSLADVVPPWRSPEVHQTASRSVVRLDEKPRDCNWPRRDAPRDGFLEVNQTTSQSVPKARLCNEEPSSKDISWRRDASRRSQEDQTTPRSVGLPVPLPQSRFEERVLPPMPMAIPWHSNDEKDPAIHYYREDKTDEIPYAYRKKKTSKKGKR
ncbi:transcription intermediary factor 1-alpha-like [Amphiura filiformis]|uniref:transcription intermediary factor 1-alpha-like n=1 Tax=Amphiura filiformis TaxID=82378 RepID=UPI003B225D6D